MHKFVLLALTRNKKQTMVNILTFLMIPLTISSVFIVSNGIEQEMINQFLKEKNDYDYSLVQPAQGEIRIAKKLNQLENIKDQILIQPIVEEFQTISILKDYVKVCGGSCFFVDLVISDSVTDMTYIEETNRPSENYSFMVFSKITQNGTIRPKEIKSVKIENNSFQILGLFKLEVVKPILIIPTMRAIDIFKTKVHIANDSAFIETFEGKMKSVIYANFSRDFLGEFKKIGAIGTVTRNFDETLKKAIGYSITYSRFLNEFENLKASFSLFETYLFLMAFPIWIMFIKVYSTMKKQKRDFIGKYQEGLINRGIDQVEIAKAETLWILLVALIAVTAYVFLGFILLLFFQMREGIVISLITSFISLFGLIIEINLPKKKTKEQKSISFKRQIQVLLLTYFIVSLMSFLGVLIFLSGGSFIYSVIPQGTKSIMILIFKIVGMSFIIFIALRQLLNQAISKKFFVIKKMDNKGKSFSQTLGIMIIANLIFMIILFVHNSSIDHYLLGNNNFQIDDEKYSGLPAGIKEKIVEIEVFQIFSYEGEINVFIINETDISKFSNIVQNDMGINLSPLGLKFGKGIIGSNLESLLKANGTFLKIPILNISADIVGSFDHFDLLSDYGGIDKWVLIVDDKSGAKTKLWITDSMSDQEVNVLKSKGVYAIRPPTLIRTIFYKTTVFSKFVDIFNELLMVNYFIGLLEHYYILIRSRLIKKLSIRGIPKRKGYLFSVQYVLSFNKMNWITYFSIGGMIYLFGTMEYEVVQSTVLKWFFLVFLLNGLVLSLIFNQWRKIQNV